MKTSKKVLSTFLALFMVLTMFSGSAFAADSANQLTGFGSDIASIGITGDLQRRNASLWRSGLREYCSGVLYVSGS